MNTMQMNEVKDELLSSDIRQLGRLLGDAIRNHLGDPAFERIEHVRQRPSVSAATMMKRRARSCRTRCKRCRRKKPRS